MSNKESAGKFAPAGSNPAATGRSEVAGFEVTMTHVSPGLLPQPASGASGSTPTASQPAQYHATGNVPGTLQGATFLHPPDRLIRGRVIYKAKYLGHLKVKQSRGSTTVKDAIDKLKLVALVHNTNEPGSGSTDVDISISVRAVTCTRRGTKDVLHQHALHIISYCADDKRKTADQNVVCYIAKTSPKSEENICFVYETLLQQAKDVTATIGQAFELAWRKFEDTKAKTKDTVKYLREKIKMDDKQKELLMQHLLLQAHENIPAGYRQPSTINQKPVRMAEGLTQDQKKDLDSLMSQAKEVVESETKPNPMMTKQVSAILQWDSLTAALPGTVPPDQLSDLDKAIFDIEEQIKELEDVFDKRRHLELGEVMDVELPTSRHAADDEHSKKIMEDIEEKLREIQASTDDIDLPDLPVNFVMDEFVKAREQAKMPKKGTVKKAAGAWDKMTTS